MRLRASLPAKGRSCSLAATRAVLLRACGNRRRRVRLRGYTYAFAAFGRSQSSRLPGVDIERLSGAYGH
eukprot:15452550-Alexandrium_andersonii.AAC.1